MDWAWKAELAKVIALFYQELDTSVTGIEGKAAWAFLCFVLYDYSTLCLKRRILFLGLSTRPLSLVLKSLQIYF